MTNQQMDKLRLLAAVGHQTRPGLKIKPRSIVIASGKGGVGKTTLAVNLAVALSDLGVGCGIIDADLSLADAHVHFGFRPTSDISDIIHKEKSPARTISRLPDGPWILAGINGDTEMASLKDDDRQKLITSFKEISAPLKVLLLDAAAGAGPDITDFALWADELMLITMPDPTAILDAYGLLKIYHTRGGCGPIGVVVNRVKQHDDYAGIVAALRSTAQGFLGVDVEDYGSVPDDPAAADALSARRPLVRLRPQAPASKAIRKIAENIKKRLPWILNEKIFHNKLNRIIAPQRIGG